MDAMAYPRFETKPATVRRVTWPMMEVELERGIRFTIKSEVEARTGQPVEVLMRGVLPLAVRPITSAPTSQQ